MFVDVAKVSVAAGRGGNGVVSFRHEKFVDKGGPDGGDGGRGGNVIFVADANMNTLASFRFQPKLLADNGGNGAKRNQHGKNGKDLLVKVPVGTVVRHKPLSSTTTSETASPPGIARVSRRALLGPADVSEVVADSADSSETILADLVEPEQETIVAKGGDGGFGNAHFKSSTRQAPRVAELGEEGEKFELILELKLLADVGLVGFPNAGKSTFLSVVTSAKPEIADYPFTTLTPNLGVADIDGASLLIADIPGLIEGAAEGKGLGDAFLRHIERTSVILHLIDVLSDDVAGDYAKIRAELAKYNPDLVERPEIVALSKIDAVDDEIVAMQSTALQNVTDSPIYAISSSAHKGTTEVLRALLMAVEAAKEQETDVEVGGKSEIPVISLSDVDLDQAWRVEQITTPADPTTRGRSSRPSSRGSSLTPSPSFVSPPSSGSAGTFLITGSKIEKFAKRTDFDNIHGVNRLRDIIKKMGITHELERQGATGESIIQIGNHEFTLLEQ